MFLFWGKLSHVRGNFSWNPAITSVHWCPRISLFHFFKPWAPVFRVSKSQIMTSHAPQHAGPMRWRSLQWSSFACRANAPQIAIPWRAPNGPTWRCASPCQRWRVYSAYNLSEANIQATGRPNRLEVTCSSMRPWTALPLFRSMLSGWGSGGIGGIAKPIRMSLFQAMSYQSSRSTGSGLSFQNLSLSWYLLICKNP